MKNFSKILNKIARGYASPLISLNEEMEGHELNDPHFDMFDPCCSALNFFAPSRYRFEQLQALKDGLRNNNPKLSLGEYKIRYLGTLMAIVTDFVVDYCECNDVSATPNSCQTALNDKVRNSRSFNTWLQEVENNTSDPSFAKSIQSVNHAFNELIDAAVDTFNMGSASDNFSAIRTDTLKNFLDDMCKIMPGNASGNQFEKTMMRYANAVAANPVIDRLITNEYFGIEVSTQEEPVLVDCPPSANDNTIGALAAALGVSAAVVAVALAALRRGKTKQCSDVAVTARNLTPLLIAATGASFATTQTSEATVQERLQAVLQKDCEGRLPYSCGDGGFEGSDDGDDSGEVDAPGGGGGVGGGSL